MVDSYRILHAYFVNRENREYKAPWNQILNIPRVYTPGDTAVQTPNSDTPYSMVGMDLRAEPIVLTVPAIDKERYFSIQLIDRLHAQFRLHRQSRHWQRWRQLPDRRSGLARRDATGREASHPFGDGVGVRRVSHAAVQPGRPRQCEEGPSGLQGGVALDVSRSAAPKTAPAIDFLTPLTPETQKTSPAVLQHPELHATVLPDASVRERTDGAIRHDRRRRRQDVRRAHAHAGHETSHRGRHGRRVGRPGGVEEAH